MLEALNGERDKLSDRELAFVGNFPLRRRDAWYQPERSCSRGDPLQERAICTRYRESTCFGVGGRRSADREGDSMKRISTVLAVAALTITLIVISLAPALANHNPAHTQRQINKLQNQVNTLKSQVASLRADVQDLNHDVFTCTFLAIDQGETFDDGTFAYPLFYDSVCA
jgi:hypothetical protein